MRQGKEHFPTDRSHLQRHKGGRKPLSSGDICFQRGSKKKKIQASPNIFGNRSFTIFHCAV